MKDIPFNSSRTFFFGLNFGFSIKVVCRFSVQIRNSIKKYYPQYCSVKKIMVFEITSSWLLLLGLFSISTLNCGSISEGFQYKTFAIKIRRFHHIFRWFSKGIESLPQTLILYPYIFGTQCRKSLIFQTCIIWSNRIHSLKYLRSYDIGIQRYMI